MHLVPLGDLVGLVDVGPGTVPWTRQLVDRGLCCLVTDQPHVPAGLPWFDFRPVS
jgi:hypothetical protein